MPQLPDTRWFLIDTADPQWRGVIEGQCAARHKAQVARPVELSTQFNVAGTQVLIKVVGADAGWRGGRAWPGRAVRVYDPDDHNEAKALLRTPEWTFPEEGPGGPPP